MTPMKINSFVLALLLLAGISACVATDNTGSFDVPEADRIAYPSPIPQPGSEAERNKTQAEKIMRKIAEFRKAHADMPEEKNKHNRTVKWVYLVPNDMTPARDYEKRLTGWANAYENYLKEEMAANFFPPRAPLSDRNADGTIHFYMVKGDFGKSHYVNDWVKSGWPMYRECRKKLIAAKLFDMHSETCYLVSPRLYEDNDDFAVVGASYGDIHDHGGTGFALDHPLLALENMKSDRPVRFRDPSYGSGQTMMQPLYEQVCYHMGNPLHEFLHACGLPHNATRGESLKRGVGFMGMGTVNFMAEQHKEFSPDMPRAAMTFADCARLVAHPLYTGYCDGFGDETSAVLNDFRFENDKIDGNFLVKGKISDCKNGTPYLAVFYTDYDMQSEFWDSYTTPSWTGVVEDDGSFTVRIDPKTFPNSKRWKGRLCICFTNGNYLDFDHVFFRGMNPEKLPDKRIECSQVRTSFD